MKLLRKPGFIASRMNPYAPLLEKPAAIRLDEQSIAYFKSVSAETGTPCQGLIDMYLEEYAASGKRLDWAWK